MQAFHEQRAYKDNFRLLANHSQGIEFLAHWHDEIELFAVFSGQQQIGINRRKLTLTAGSIALIAPWDIHYYQSPFRLDEKASAYLLIFPPEMIPRHLFQQSGIWQIQSAGTLTALATLLQQLSFELETRHGNYDLAATGLLNLILARILRSTADSSYEVLDRSRLTSSPVIQQVLKYIEQHYHETLGRDQLAAFFKLSPAHFSRGFKAATGLTFTAYLNQLRLQKACQQLRQTRKPITEIAFSCGFDSIRTFNRVFNQLAGCKPSEIRN